MKKLLVLLGVLVALLLVTSVVTAAPAEITYGGAKYLAENIGDTDMGKVAVDGNKIVMTGCGADVWDAADAFFYMYKNIAGDFTATLKVEQVSDANGWGKIGIMVRTNTTAGSTHAMVCATNSNNLAFQFRPEADAASSHVAGTDEYTNGSVVYLKLVRKADVVTGFYSFDNKAWTQFETDNVTLPGSALIGVFHTSHDAANSGVDGVAYDFEVK